MMDESAQAVEQVEPRKKRKYTRRKTKIMRAKERIVPAEFAGLTLLKCCDACSDKECVISGTFYCAHPRKGGLQDKEMVKTDAVDRFRRAKRALGHLVLDAKEA